MALLLLLALAQACGAGSHGKPATVGPPDGQAPRRALTGCSGDSFRIDLLDAIGSLPDDTLDAQREQLRDWIWTVTLGRIAQRTSADEVLASVADEPLERDDALAHVLHMQVGPTRSTSTKSGGAVVLVEAADAQTVAAEVAEALDQEALHLGSTPAEAQVYQYVFQPEVARAEVCAMKPLARAEIESAARRARSATITTAAELAEFLSGGVDLLSAQCGESGLKVTGRQRPRSLPASLGVEHIAALTQARGTRYVPLDRFGFSLDMVSNRAQLKENARRLDALRAPAEIQPPDIQILLAWKRQHPGVSTEELMMSLELQREAWGRPGFSLDPLTSASFAATQLGHLIDALPDAEKLAGVLRAFGEDERAMSVVDLAQSTNEPFAQEAREALIAARGRLQKASNEDAEAILHPELPDSLGNDIAEDLLKLVWKRSSQQCARYDGPLTGTATGMTFFYTDLLAKIWLIDLDGAAPQGSIEGFESGIHQARSTASCQDEGEQNTRIWFGVREESFSRESSGAVRFAPMATRIFAKSSKPGSRQDESEATAGSRRFVRWWDDHFRQIAAWEPQYEVLNQLMKWSVVVQSAAVAEDHACLGFLDEVPVKSSHRIDAWVAETRGLKWRGPVSLLPPPRGAKATQGSRECLLLLESKPFSACGSDGRSIAGGVSAATYHTVKAKPIREARTPAHLGRLGGVVAPHAVDAGRVHFKKVLGRGGELDDVSIESQRTQVKFEANVNTASSQVGSGSSWHRSAPVKRIEKSVEVQGNGLVAQQRINGLVSQELKATDLAAGDVKLLPTRPVKLEAQKVAKRMLQDGVGLPEAAHRELGPTHEITHLRDGSVIARPRPGSRGGMDSIVMESGGGNRGPPSARARASLEVGVPDGAPHRPGSAVASRTPIIRVTILKRGSEGELIAARGGKLLQAGDPTVVEVRSKLQGNDDDGAMQTFARRPTPDAAQALLDHALEAGDMTRVGRVVKHVIQVRPPPSQLRAHREAISVARARHVREGGDPRPLDRFAMMLMFSESKQLTAGRAEVLVRAASDGEIATYAPPSYPRGAQLPPPVHPPGKLLLPEEQYVTRVVQGAATRELPATLDVGGTEYQMRASGKDVPLSYAEVGSPYRLLAGLGLPIAYITRCSDLIPELPPCHERPSPEERQRYQEAIACDRDGDRAFTTPEERECLDDLRRKARKPAQAPAQSAP
ncbi:hypothetical protein WMF04_17190 [Sorangium sp. So ce260]|uniref:hypothetical protein n=1 Tax=Sorangium sp. So ce260 TaxID=3133291 RepID=UPI003F5E4B7D